MNFEQNNLLNVISYHETTQDWHCAEEFLPLDQ